MRNPIIRTIYLYLFALVGLGMLVVGAATFVNLGLKVFVFTKADRFMDHVVSRPMPLYFDGELSKVENIKDKCDLTDSQRESIDQWIADYKEFKEKESDRDPNGYVTRRRHQQASTATSLMLVGLPLWLFHWRIIKSDTGGQQSV